MKLFIYVACANYSTLVVSSITSTLVQLELVHVIVNYDFSRGLLRMTLTSTYSYSTTQFRRQD